MNPNDEMRALTCHCGRIACRHHEDENPTPTCDCKTRPWEDTIGAYDYTD